jgi:hypothetical protein
VRFEAEAVRELLERSEGRDLEFKRGLPRGEKIARTLCAFANTRGGVLLVGVDDRGRVLGAGKAREVAGELDRVAAELLDPPLRVEIGIARLGEGPVVCCSVPVSRARPHAVLRADGSSEIVVRVGSSNRAAEGATLRALRAPPATRKSLDPLGRRILVWVAQHTKRNGQPGGDATVDRFAHSQNIGRQRARRAFLDLERAGFLVGHGEGSRRVFNLP